MPHKQHAARVPSSAQTITRSGSTAAGSTLYTVPAGKTLVILDAWVAGISGTAGTAVINVASEDDASTNAVVGVGATTVPAPLAVSCEVRCKAGTTVAAVGTTLTTFLYGFAGYLENA
jgi:hypothetical protein